MIKNLPNLFLILALVCLNINQLTASKESDQLHHDHYHHDHHHDHDHDHHHHEHLDEPPHYKYSREANVKKSESFKHQESAAHIDEPTIRHSNVRTTREIWFGAIGSTLLISIVPYLALMFIPINNPHEHQSLLKVLLSFASGGLLGDAFLHLIPHALIAQQELEQSNHDGSHSHGSHSHGSHSHGSHSHGSHSHGSHSHGGHSHDSHSHDSHGHDHEAHSHDMSVGLCVLSGILVFLMIEKFVRIIKGSHHHHHHHHGQHLQTCEDENVKEKIANSDNSESESSETNESEVKSKSDDIKVSAYLNLAADFAHNFTDGLAIGASYLAGNSIGVVTTLTILFHEVPHEIGDFAILIQSGCSKSKAMTLQLVTALGALSGTVLSLAAEGLSNTTSSWILPFTAGGFIYIATVSVIPELLEGSSLKQSFFEICALVVGVMSMVIIAQYE